MFYHKIRKFKNKYKDKRCFILANGPSILNHDLNKLNGEIVIGMNASTLLEDSYNFKHTFYTVSDLRFVKNPDKINYCTSLVSDETIKVFRDEVRDVYPIEYSKNSIYIQALERDGFSTNLASGYFYGCTTVMLAIQLAYYIGCNEIYLLGVDLTYSSEQPRFYSEKTIQIEDAFSSIQIKNIHNAHLFLEGNGVHIFNCNPLSMIRNYIPFNSYDSLFI